MFFYKGTGLVRIHAQAHPRYGQSILQYGPATLISSHKGDGK